MSMNHLKIVIILFLLGTCMSTDPNNKPSHHTKNGFRNLNPEVKAKGLGSVLSWQFQRIFQDLPSLNSKDYSFDIIENDGTLLKKNTSQFSVTWIGHATTLIQMNGINILTDPIWSERCSPVSFAGPKRYTPPGITLENLPKIDIVIISHNHYDHMDLPTLKTLEKLFSPTFFVGLGNKDFLSNEGLNKVFELDWWDEKQVNNAKIIFTPTQHFSARGIFDRDKTLWGSYIVNVGNKTIYFAGDTAYFTGFKEIGDRFPNIDFAILPIGAYEPRWFMQPVHMSPEESVQAFLDLRAKYFFPMHYQTFVLTDEALDEPLKLTKKQFEVENISMDKLIDLKIGETKFSP
jgi:N-acyl-phosphatidylethanolamine-hydrolysing phospholipase D